MLKFLWPEHGKYQNGFFISPEPLETFKIPKTCWRERENKLLSKSTRHLNENMWRALISSDTSVCKCKSPKRSQAVQHWSFYLHQRVSASDSWVVRRWTLWTSNSLTGSGIAEIDYKFSASVFDHKARHKSICQQHDWRRWTFLVAKSTRMSSRVVKDP